MKMENNRLLLITNDDGINAKGLKILIDIAREFGDIVVVAPMESQSGMSHAITMKVPLRVELVKEESGLKIYGCSGTPVDSVKLALNKILPRNPDMIISGINHGSNSSTSVIYSGTMAAAIEGCINKIPSVGLSLIDYDDDADFSHILGYVRLIIKNVLEEGIPDQTCLNVNFPGLNGEVIKGMKICRQNNGYWKEEFEKRTDPSRRNYYWLTGRYLNLEPQATDTDEWALQNNYISIVPIKVDFTSHHTIQKLKNWEEKNEK